MRHARADATAHEKNSFRSHENGELLALAQSASGAGTWDIDVAAGVTRFCPRSLEILGHVPDRSPYLTVLEWAQHIYPGDAERVLAEGLRAREAGSDLVTEYRVIRPDGEIGWVRGLGRTLFNDAGEPVRSVGLNFDITEQKRSEEKFRQMQSELIHMSRVSAMGTMAETLAHELNQPLASISNYLSGARNMLGGISGDDVEQVREAFGLSVENAHRAGEIIRRLRAMTQRGTGGRTRLALGETVAEALSLALVGTREQGISARTELAPELWIEGDHIQIQQVVLNLVRNAVEAMQGCDRRTLLVRAGAEGGRAIVRVEDSGTGISAEARATLFQPFVSSKPDGMGIGLSISRTIVEAHGGQLWAEPPSGEGATFCFALPLAAGLYQAKLSG